MRFWRGLLWGGLIGSAIGVVLSSPKPQRKPMVVQNVEDAAQTLKKSAYRARRRIMNRLTD